MSTEIYNEEEREHYDISLTDLLEYLCADRTI